MTDDLLECYRTLELEPGASPADVKQAYRDLAKIWHPDRFSNDPRVQEKAQEKLKAINRAYERLKNCRPGKPPAPPNRTRRTPHPQPTGGMQPHYDEVDPIQDGRKAALLVMGAMLVLAAIVAAWLYLMHVNNQRGSLEAKVANDEMEARRLLADAQLIREREAAQAALAAQARKMAQARQEEQEAALKAYYASQTNSRWRAFAEYRQATEQAVKDAEQKLDAAPAGKTPAAPAGEEEFQRGSDYANGRRVPLDFSEAMKWYRRAAEKGHAAAQHHLGFHYFAGRPGVPKDYVEAYKWLTLAARQGNTAAAQNLASFSQLMSAGQIEAGRRAATAFQAARTPESGKP